ncbi:MULTISPECIES: hypothetical protein [unclassified Variovorax]|uniref:hypothetical protein n=1 Tax=unclassified Variovorax TaxID=663243 RepID=UPI00076CE872|nr:MULTISPECIES: hypothetical protein [unclassified Variovorax]KWT98321.1 hypothetical protein APY03_0456 [Variovorax sp. WDL1]
MNDDTTSQGEIFKLLAPYLGGTLLLAVMVVVLLLRFSPLGQGGGGTSTVNAVTFDVVKFANAQRAVASAFLKPGSADVAEANEILLGLTERTRKTIEEVAGEGTLVLVKQSVAHGVSRDITDDVLKKLGMPTNAPTRDAVAYTLDVAPTMLMGPLTSRRPQTTVAPSGESVIP